MTITDDNETELLSETFELEAYDSVLREDIVTEPGSTGSWHG